MCGIFGYVGKTERTTGALLEGLRRLEYRGYDSAGIAAISCDGALHYKKRKGRISKLAAEVDERVSIVRGIAHTRWATHGAPSDKNAHPHTDCQKNIFVIHNGIVENWKELRDALVRKRHRFVSDTDTETLPHLIEEVLKRKPALSFAEAVNEALRLVRGAYSVVALKANGSELVAGRFSSPLVLGIGKEEYFVASDPAALLPFTREVVYLENGERVAVSPQGYRIFTATRERVSRGVEALEWDITQVSKGGYPHFMLKEIFEEPEAVLDSMRGRLITGEGLAKLGGLEQVSRELRDVRRIIITACGTAYYAGLVGEYMLEEYAGIPVEVEYASELRYRKAVFDRGTALLVISQSGETADTLAALRETKRKGVLTLGIVNVVGSSISRETDAGVYTHAGPEVAVASTKAFVSQLTVLALLTLFLGRRRGMSLVMGKRIARELERLPRLMRSVLAQRAAVMRIARKYAKKSNFLYLGRKYNYPIVLEGALKLKEIAYIHAEGYGAGEMKHGPIALIDKSFPSFFVVPSDSVYEKTLSNMEEVKARGGKIIAVATVRDKKVVRLADEVIYIPKTLEMLTPFLSVIPLHLFAYYVAALRGNDVDRPRNLAKSVTVE